MALVRESAAADQRRGYGNEYVPPTKTDERWIEAVRETFDFAMADSQILQQSIFKIMKPFPYIDRKGVLHQS